MASGQAAAAGLTMGRFWLAKRVPGVGVAEGGAMVVAGGAVDTVLLGTCGSSVTCAAQKPT